MLILDTDHISVVQRGGSPLAVSLRDRLLSQDQELAVTIITIEEQTRGWLARIHRETNPRRQVQPYEELKFLFEFFAEWDVVAWDSDAVAVFEKLRKRKIRLSTMDLKIASIAIARNAMLLSRNSKDFERIPDLQLQNWLD